MKTALLGLALTVIVTVIAVSVWGSEALPGAVGFGLMAVVIQMVAVSLLKRVWHGKFNEVLARFGFGMGLRLLGVVVLAVVVSLRPDVFRPLPSALGFIGVLIPLLYMELKLVK